MQGAPKKRFNVEFTETVHRSVTVRADSEQEATDWVEENWDDACALDEAPDVKCEVNHCYEMAADESVS